MSVPPRRLLLAAVVLALLGAPLLALAGGRLHARHALRASLAGTPPPPPTAAAAALEPGGDAAARHHHQPGAAARAHDPPHELGAHAHRRGRPCAQPVLIGPDAGARVDCTFGGGRALAACRTPALPARRRALRAGADAPRRQHRRSQRARALTLRRRAQRAARRCGASTGRHARLRASAVRTQAAPRRPPRRAPAAASRTAPRSTSAACACWRCGPRPAGCSRAPERWGRSAKRSVAPCFQHTWTSHAPPVAHWAARMLWARRPARTSLACAPGDLLLGHGACVAFAQPGAWVGRKCRGACSLGSAVSHVERSCSQHIAISVCLLPACWPCHALAISASAACTYAILIRGP